MKITKDDFTKIVAEVIKEQTADALEKGNSDVAMALLLMGAKVGTDISTKLFESNEELEVITDKE